MKLIPVLISLSVMLIFSACNDSPDMSPHQNNSENPFFYQSSLPFEAPDFDTIREEHYRPAFNEGIRIELEEIEEIASNPEAPTFENTIVAMERTGELLTRTQRVFYNLTSATLHKRRVKVA